MASIDYFMSDKAILEFLGVCIKNMRLNIQYSQRELSEMTGLSRSTISAVENGKAVTTDALLKILRYLRQLEVLKPFEEYQELIDPVLYMKCKKKFPKRIRNVKKI
ncbi:MAG: helix-turn-helix domain-containing protein [Paludibacteraceae bacterium]|nr:helix-turn-helix domain-containing protein [Paludibacteraceae bacterium]